MSGRKYSDYRLKKERAERLEILQRVKSLHSEVDVTKKRIDSILSETSEGLKTTFSGEVSKAKQWVVMSIPDISNFDFNTDKSTLQSTESKLRDIANEGSRVQESLVLTFTKKADEMGRQLTGRLARAETEYQKNQHLLSLWHNQDELNQLEQTLHKASRHIANDDYNTATEVLQSFEKKLNTKSEISKTQEDKHQKRLYLLDSLKKTCNEMGFDVIQDAVQEDEQDRGSAYTFMVDTYSKGRIQFTLTLDQIKSFSEAEDDYCPEQYTEIAKYLDDKFGFENTEFRYEDGTPLPEKIEKGAKDLPHGDEPSIKRTTDQNK